MSVGIFCCYLFLFRFALCFFLSHYPFIVTKAYTAPHLCISTYTDQTTLKVTQHLFYLYLSFSALSSPLPPIPPFTPVPAVHPCVIDGGAHPPPSSATQHSCVPKAPLSFPLTCRHQMAHHLPPTVNKSCNYPSCPTKGNSHFHKCMVHPHTHPRTQMHKEISKSVTFSEK